MEEERVRPNFWHAPDISEWINLRVGRRRGHMPLLTFIGVQVCAPDLQDVPMRYHYVLRRHRKLRLSFFRENNQIIHSNRLKLHKCLKIDTTKKCPLSNDRHWPIMHWLKKNSGSMRNACVACEISKKVWLYRTYTQTDGRTHAGQSDPYVSLCFAGDKKNQYSLRLYLRETQFYFLCPSLKDQPGHLGIGSSVRLSVIPSCLHIKFGWWYGYRLEL